MRCDVCVVFTNTSLGVRRCKTIALMGRLRSFADGPDLLFRSLSDVNLHIGPVLYGAF